MIKRVRPARHYQRADDATRRLADAAHSGVRHELRSAFANLKAVVPVRAVADALKAGNDPRRVIPFDHFREVLRSGFTKLVALYVVAGQQGAKSINGRFRQAQRPMHYRKAYNDNEPRDEHGRWTGGGGGGSAKQLMAANARRATQNFNDNRSTQTWGHAQTALPDGNTLHTVMSQRGSNSRGARRGSGLTASHRIDAPTGGSIARGIAGVESHLRGMGLSKIDKARTPRESAAYQFDSLSPDTLATLRDTQDALIQQLESDARDTIETAVADGVANGLSADDIAENIRDVISLTESQAQAVLNYQSSLYNLDQSALDRSLRNTDYDATVQDAIDSGEFLSEDQVQSMVDDYVENYIDYRADTIARTESVRAANQGLHDSYSQAVERGVFPEDAVTRTWQLADRPCPICESIPDNNPDGVGVNDDFDSDDGPVSDPPVHPNCMCSVEYVTDLSKVPEDDTEDEEATA